MVNGEVTVGAIRRREENHIMAQLLDEHSDAIRPTQRSDGEQIEDF